MREERKRKPHEDDLECQRIEIEFAIPVFLPQGFLRELDGLLSSAVRMPENQVEGHVHWVSGHGSKPLWSQLDARFLGKTPADDAPETGEPRWDDSVYHIETTCRPLHPGEKDRSQKPNPLLDALKLAQPEFCSTKCPSVFRGPDSARHVPECEAMRAAIQKAEGTHV